MTTDSLPTDSPAPRSTLALNLIVLVSIALALMLATLFGYWLGMRQTSAPDEPSAEVGFARDMMAHHAQAVDMATLLRDRTDDPEVRQLTLDIMLTQQAQIGQMQGWLAAWDLPIAHTGPAMAWMGMPTTDLMPGMATLEQLNQLRSMMGVEADGLFLQLMISHHRGGVLMGQAALKDSQRPEVRALAQAIVNAQTSEITYMQELLQRKGFAPAPEATPAMNHGEMTP